ncbi:MAG: PIG-L family deacetylase [Pseudomonadota bacterium]
MIGIRRLKLWGLGLALLGALALALWLGVRVSSYQKLLGFRADQDYRYDFSQTEAKRLPVQLEGDGFTWPQGAKRWDTGFLELRVQADLAGGLNDPYLTVEAGGRQFRQFLERGVKGLRYLNLSPLAHPRLQAGQRVSLKGDHLSWPRQQANLVLFRNRIGPMTRVLVVAPHPDDAEIAAFGLYSHRDSYVITLTAGEAGDGFSEPFQESRRRRQIIKGKLRVFDSITVPYWGGLGLGRACNLGYFDATLSWMYHHPDQEVTSPAMQSSDVKMFRRCIWASLLQDKKPKATWKNLVADLTYVLKSLKPHLIVLPHPLLDSHPDHRYAALAVFQAIAEAGLTKGDLLLYTNHHIFTEMYPFGDEDGLVSLPPWFKDTWLFSRVYSYQMHPGQQTEKYFALEAMHDLRGSPSGQRNSLDLLSMGLDKAMGEMLDLDDADSYFRRAVRPNELFFVVPVSQVPRLAAETEKALK